MNDRGVRYRDLKRGPTDAKNLAGMPFYDIEEISVNEYHPLPDGQGPATQVHVMLKLERVEHPMVMRFKGPGSLDQFIVQLITHRNRVWPKQENSRKGRGE